MSSNHSHWEIPVIPVGIGGLPPSYAEHSIRSQSEIEEIGAAISAPYKHFQAVLTPERNFLHYLISGLICNAEIPSKEYLFEQVERLYDSNVERLSNGLGGKGEANDIASILERATVIKELAKEYYQSRKNHSEMARPIPEEWQDFFRRTYQTLQHNFHTGDYLPGMREAPLDTPEKVFCRICENQCAREDAKQSAKALAQSVIAEEIQSGRISPLEQHQKNERYNVVLTGVIGAGKNYFLEKMIGKGSIKREQFAFVDLDELKEFRRIVDRTNDDPTAPPSWNKRAHDECHIIRRKILDELEEKIHRGLAPNVLLTTSVLSERALSTLTHGNVATNLYLFYCEPDQALRNSLERHQNGGRRMSTEVVLSSVKNLARSIACVLYQTTGDNHNLFVQMIDTTDARKTGTRTMLKADRNNGLHLFDLDAFIQLQKGAYIDPKATSPEGAYTPHDESELYTRCKAILRSHHVSFCTPDGKPLAIKEMDSDTITPVRTVGLPNHLGLERLDPELLSRHSSQSTEI